jgi:hypothetical protein
VTGIDQVAQAGAVELHRRHLPQHPDQLCLDKLGRRDGSAELGASSGVGQGDLVGRHRVTGRGPGHHVAGPHEHRGHVGERVAVSEAPVLTDADVVEDDVGVLHDAQADLVRDLGGGEPGIVALDHEGLDPAVIDVAGEDHDDVAPDRVCRASASGR